MKESFRALTGVTVDFHLEVLKFVKKNIFAIRIPKVLKMLALYPLNVYQMSLLGGGYN